jgi:hypothetical protein
MFTSLPALDTVVGAAVWDCQGLVWGTKNPSYQKPKQSEHERGSRTGAERFAFASLLNPTLNPST